MAPSLDAPRAQRHQKAKRAIKRRSPVVRNGRSRRDDDSSDEDADPEIDREAYTIPEFCVAHRLSVAMYFKMKVDGDGPREMRFGRRVAISREAARDWRRDREKAQEKS